MLVALTSIHWREAWKYGERAFRYCQHDLGHAIAALGVAAALVGWRATSAARVVASRDRRADRRRSRRRLRRGRTRGTRLHRRSRRAGDGPIPPWTPACSSKPCAAADGRARASQLSEDHVEWTFIDEIARADCRILGTLASIRRPADVVPGQCARSQSIGRLDARSLILQRRSAVAFDGRSIMDRSAFFDMLCRVMPGPRAPWNTLWWTPRIHLAIFVHRVNGLAPGMYLLARDPRAIDRLRAACGREFLWESAHDEAAVLLPGRAATAEPGGAPELRSGHRGRRLLQPGDDRRIRREPRRVRRHRSTGICSGNPGVVGQVLYLEAEAAGARATGIGCFYDDPVHDTLGLQGHAFQSLYHFTVGMPVEDGRLTTEPGYEWETRSGLKADTTCAIAFSWLGVSSDRDDPGGWFPGRSLATLARSPNHGDDAGLANVAVARDER